LSLKPILDKFYHRGIADLDSSRQD